jgi:hypothetical protein
MYESCKAGKILDLPSLPTLSDGSAGGVDPDAVSPCHLMLDNSIIPLQHVVPLSVFNSNLTNLFFFNLNILVKWVGGGTTRKCSEVGQKRCFMKTMTLREHI